MKLFIICLLLAIVFMAVAISKTPKSNSDMAVHYFEELNKAPNTIKIVDVKSKFLRLFSDFKQGANEEIIRQTYADKFYFNDTFKVLDNIEELVPYMVETAKNVNSTTVDILDVAESGSDYYLRWVMIMEFEAKGKDIYSQSTGMTQLRFDSEGKVIFHQDFWDTTEGFYQHLPYVGYLFRKIRSKL